MSDRIASLAIAGVLRHMQARLDHAENELKISDSGVKGPGDIEKRAELWGGIKELRAVISWLDEEEYKNRG